MKKVLVGLIVFLSFHCSAQNNEVIYYKCLHRVKLDSNDFKKFTFNVKGADTIMSPDGISLVPIDSQVVLSIYKKEKLEKKTIYKVIKTPLPSLEVRQGRRNISNEKNISIKAGQLSLIARPNSAFVQTHRLDARHSVGEFEVSIKRNGQIIKNVAGKGQLMTDTMRAGDQLILTISKVRRLNFRNEADEIIVNKTFYFNIVQ